MLTTLIGMEKKNEMTFQGYVLCHSLLFSGLRNNYNNNNCGIYDIICICMCALTRVHTYTNTQKDLKVTQWIPEMENHE